MKDFLRARLRTWLDVPPPRPRRKRSIFAGAKQSNALAGWVFAPTNIDEILRGELPVLRQRARDLHKNNFLVRAFGNQYSVNVFGPHGIRLQSKVTQRFTDDLDETVNRVIEEAWMEWTKTCDITGRRCLQEIEDLAGKCLWRDGEAFIPRKRGFKGNRFSYGVSVLDPCLIDDQYNEKLSNGHNVCLGVELDAMGTVIAFHVRTSTKTVTRDRQRIPANDLLHVFQQDEPGQTRGVPRVAAAMVSVKHLDGLMEAAVVNARSKALTMGFLKDEPGEEGDDLEGDDIGGNGETVWDMEPGTIRDIGQKTFQGFDPGFPDAAFEGFVKAVEKAITSCLPGSYASVSGDIENASWSALRNDEMRAKCSWACEQQFWIRNVRRVIWEDWLQQALLAGQLRLGEQRVFTLADFDRLNKPQWFPPVYPSADETKRQNANKIRLEMGTASRAEIIAEEGKDMFDVDQARRASEASEAGIAKPAPAGQPAAPPRPMPAVEEDEEEEAA